MMGIPERKPERTDVSAIDEMARRLRAFGAYDGRLADAVCLLVERIQTMDAHLRIEGYEYERIRRPLASWADCGLVLAAMARSRWALSMCDAATPVEAVLCSAVLLHVWSQEGRPVPSDVRAGPAGSVIFEWENVKPRPAYVFFDGRHTTGEPAPAATKREKP